MKDRKPGELIARLDFDPYERSLRYVATHVLARELTEPAVRDALKHGHAYVAHDWLCDSTGFAFAARDRGASKTPRAIMGDELPLTNGLTLNVAAPVSCILKLISNGRVIQTVNSNRLDFDVKAPDVYRIEGWLEVDGEQRPWIYSNPIYVR